MIYQLDITTAADTEFFLNDFKDKFSWLEERGYNVELCEDENNTPNDISVEIQLKGRNKDKLFRDEDIVYIFKHQMSEFLAEHITSAWEKELVWKEIHKKKRHIHISDKAIVFTKAIEFLKSCNSNESLNLLMNYGRKNKIAHRILEYLTLNSTIYVEGFINFCMQDYLTEIKFAVDLACEELKNEKEYNEFVKLLRYFVDAQPPAINEVNLMMDNNGCFSLWDGDGNMIEEKYMNYYLDDILLNDINLDDVLISILITVAPRRIILHHAKRPDSEPVKMIKNVFSERITECPGCDRCSTYNAEKHRK